MRTIDRLSKQQAHDSSSERVTFGFSAFSGRLLSPPALFGRGRGRRSARSFFPLCFAPAGIRPAWRPARRRWVGAGPILFGFASFRTMWRSDNGKRATFSPTGCGGSGGRFLVRWIAASSCSAKQLLTDAGRRGGSTQRQRQLAAAME